ncbi:MAG: alanine--tRNA ligase [Candidatus Pacebacteria bacterium]|nr:alanine--tRNA ligase [Candidatus Paceibacterota bacterium]
MLAKELRQKYLEFFETKKHSIISSASIIPENDPTVLFTTAGMHPLIPYLMGEKHPKGTRLVDAQKCIRTTDIEEVGDTTHHTFFEMMGNWSLGDYFKKESLEWSWEFLTSHDWLALDPKRFAVSVFKGDEVASFDQEAYDIWKEIFVKEGIPEDRIAKLDKDANWWGPAGETGPCGPDSEIFYWVGDIDKIPQSFNDDNDLWVEVWNNVFMEFNKNEEGVFEKLASQNVDTGFGLERVTAVMQGLDDNYKTELWTNVISKIEELSGKKYGESEDVTKAMRVIADHIKASVLIIGDDRGLTPSNTDQGYIVRRLLRRAIRYGKQLEISQELWLKEVAKEVVDVYKDIYLELERNLDFVLEQLDKEEIQFSKTLEKGLRELNRLISNIPLEKTKLLDISGKDFFNLFQTYGFPFEMIIEEIKNRGFLVDEDGMFSSFYKEKKKEFEEKMKEHQELSRTASVGKFKSGLADDSEETTHLHTAAHLLLAALQKVLSQNVIQKGSNITADRLRFDFSWDEKLTDEQKTEVEKIVNEVIKQNISVECNEMPIEEAKNQGASGIFTDKYGDIVKVYKIGDFSQELCSGPHVKNTGELGKLKIIKEESSSAGVRRIKAILEK